MDDQASSSVKKINAMKARQNFGTMLEEVYYRGNIYIVERAGKPMAALIPLSQLEALQKHAGQTKTAHDALKGNKRQAHKRKA
jgi:prevent-host-death family protein